MDVVLHVCNSCMLTMIVLMNFGISLVNTYVILNFQPAIIHMHEDINITCTVHGIQIINRKLTRQWSKGPDLICYNGHSIDSNKYTEISTTGNQFKLHIRNVSESDFNYKYQCRYGFESDAENIRLSKDNFEYPPADNTRAIVHSNDLHQGLTINLNFKKIFPVPRCRAILRGPSLYFNISSSTHHGILYEINLSLTSTNKLQCNEEVVVKCILINEYTIPTEDIRKCKINENLSAEINRVLVGAVICLILLTVSCILVSYLILKQKKEVNIRKLVLPCYADRKRENEVDTCSNSSSIKADNYEDEGLACLNAEEDV